MVAKTNVSSRQGQKKGWQAAPLFQRGGERRVGQKQTAQHTVLYLGEISRAMEPNALQA
jgi:hypothetical protein